MVKKIPAVLFFLFFSYPVLAQATFFENLGFSTDGRYFLFGQYGSNAITKKPFAEVYFVHVDRNVYYPGGVFVKRYDHVLEVGEEGGSALFALMSSPDVSALRTKLNINHLATGRLIYIVYDEEGEEKDFSRRDISFEDVIKGETYRVTLRQSVQNVADEVESSFFINTQLLGKGGVVLKNIRVGHPSYNRSGIINYRVARVYLAPKERDLLFVVERQNKRPDGTFFYDYMIEIGRLK